MKKTKKKKKKKGNKKDSSEHPIFIKMTNYAITNESTYSHIERFDKLYPNKSDDFRDTEDDRLTSTE